MSKNQKNTTKIYYDFISNMTQPLKDLNEFRALLKNTSKESLIGKASIEEVSRATTQMGELADRARLASGGYDSTQIRKELTLAGKSVADFNHSMDELGRGDARITGISERFASLPTNIKKSETAVDRFGKALFNSMRYNLVNQVVDGISSITSTVQQFFKSVDKNLTQIRIVTGKSENAMESMYRTGIQGAKEYGKYTREYLETAQIYYQQGLSQAEVMERTNATLMASNISGLGVSEAAEQITAVLNGYNIEASRTMEVLDMMAKIGAETATDFSEIAASMQKVAASASETGMSVESTLGMISTISSVTREAPETIGTSLNAIISRLGALKAEEINDASSFTSQVEKAMLGTGSGLTTMDSNGMLKDTTTILTEVAEKWDDLNVNQQRALTTAMAGTRQANRLMALLGNWEMYEDYTSKAENATGAMEEQNKMYLESYEASQKRLAATTEELVSNLLDRDTMKDFTDFLATMVGLMSELTKGAGGLFGMMGKLSPLLASMAGKQVVPFLSNKITASMNKKADLNKYQNTLDEINTEGESLTGEKPVKLSAKDLSAMPEAAAKAYIDAAESVARYNSKLKEAKALSESGVTAEEVSQAGKKKLAKALGEELKATKAVEEAKNRIIDNEKKQITINETINKLKEKQNKLDKEGSSLTEKEIKKLEEQQALLAKNKTALANDRRAVTNANKKLNTQKTEEALTAYARDKLQVFEEDGSSKDEIAELKQRLSEQFNDGQGFDLEIGRIHLGDKTAKELEKEVDNIFNTTVKNRDDRVTKLNRQLADEPNLEKDTLLGLEKGQVIAKGTQAIVRGAGLAAGAYSALKAATDENSTSQEKAQGVMMAVGSTMATIPGPAGAIGMALMTLGPIFVEVFGIGVSQSEKLQKAVDKVTKSLDKQLATIRQQKLDLAPVSTLYESLAKSYEEQAFAYRDLDEAMRGQYDQVAEYVAVYAPELIRYYDEQGKAVLDLTRGIEYLNEAYNRTESLTYQNLAIDLTGNVELLKQQSTYLQKTAIETQNKIQEKQDALLGSKSQSQRARLNKDIEALNVKLTETKNSLSSVGVNWSEMVSTPVLKTIEGFNELDESTQNAARAAVDYRSAVLSGFGEENYVARVKEAMETLGALTKEQKENFKEMAIEVQTGIIKIVAAMDMLTTTQQIQMFSMTQSDFVSGSFLDEMYKISPQEFAQARLDELLEAKSIMEEKMESLVGDSGPTQYYSDNSAMGAQAAYGENYKTTAQPSISGYDSNPLSGAEGTYSKEIEELKESAKIAQQEISDISRSLWDTTSAEYDKLVSEQEKYFDEIEEVWQSSLMDLARSVEGHNEIYDEYIKEKARLDKLASTKGGDTQYKNEVEQNAKRLAVLMQDDEDYYDALKKNNAVQMQENLKNLQVDANNYRTYAEYKAAVDAAVIQQRQQLEEIAMLQDEDREKAIFNFKLSNAMKLLEMEGDIEGKKLLIMATADQQEEMMAVMSAKREVDELIEMLKKEKKLIESGAQDTISIKEAELRRKLELMNQEISAYNKVGQAKADAEGTDFTAATGLSENTIYGVYKGSATDSLDYMISELEGQSKALQARYDELKTQINKENADFRAVLDKAMNGAQLNFEGLNFTPEQKKLAQEAVDLQNDLASATENVVEDIKEEIDYLREYNILLDELNRKLEKVNHQKSISVGPAYLKALKEEQKLLAESVELEKMKEKLAKEESERLKGEIAKSSKKITYNDFGMIENYNQILKAAEEKINKMSGDAKEKAIEEWEELKEMMEAYEAAVGDQYDALESQRQKFVEASALQLENITYQIDMVINLSERNKEVLDAVAAFAKLKSGKMDISFDFGNSLKNLSSLADRAEALFTTLAQGTGNSIEEIMANAEMTDVDKEKALEKIKDEYISQMEELVSTLQEMDEMFESGLESVVSTLQDHLSAFDSILSQYEYMMNLIDRAGGDPASKNGLLDSSIGIYKNQADAYAQVAQQLKTSRDSFEKGSDEWLAANSQYMSAMEQVVAAEQNLLSALESRYDNTVASGRTSLEEALFGGMSADEAVKALEKQQEAREKYLDTQERIYATSQLQRTLEEEINKYTNNPKAQAQLKKFMDDEMKHLKNKEKLTKADFDLAQKQFDIVKARIALEEAREQKQFVQSLQRNENGTFGFIFSAGDNEDLKKAQKEYEDAINALYEYAEGERDRLEKESLTIKQNFLSDYDEILAKLKAGQITEEEASDALLKSREEMLEKLKENAEQQAIMSQQIAGAEILQILASAGADANAFAGLENQAEAIKSVFDVLEDAKAISETELSDILDGLGLDLNDYSGTFGDIISSVIDDLGGGEGALDTLMKAFGEAGNSTVETLLDLIAGSSDLAEMTDKIFDQAINGAGSNLDDFMEDALDSFRDLETQFDPNDPDSIFATVKEGILTVFKEYNEGLEDAIARMEEHLKEVENVSDIIAGSTQTVVDGLKQEIQQLVEAQKEYQKLRTEIIKTIGELETRLATVVELISSMYGQTGTGSRSTGSPSSFDTGGYTGQWSNNNGRMAILHEKEIVLNKEDTVNLLKAVKASRGTGDFGGESIRIREAVEFLAESAKKNIDAARNKAKSYLSDKLGVAQAPTSIDGLEREMTPSNLTINADFPNATNRDEITAAFETLRLNAHQYINKK